MGPPPRRVTVLGSCGAWPEPGRSCSGYVVDHGDCRVVLDLGYGTLNRLLSHCGSTAGAGITAVVISHEHADHCVDLHGLFRARSFTGLTAPRIRLFSPAGVIEVLSALDSDFASHHAEVFDWTAVPAGPQQIGPFTLTSTDLPHYVRNVGVRLAAADMVVAYTGDTGPSPELPDLGRDADVYIVEATDARRDQAAGPVVDPAMHLTAAEAGRIAADAGARRLLLTHFWPGIDRQRSRREAAAAFPGEVLIADEGLRLDLV